MLPGEREMSWKATSKNNNTADVSDGPAFVKVTVFLVLWQLGPKWSKGKFVWSFISREHCGCSFRWASGWTIVELHHTTRGRIRLTPVRSVLEGVSMGSLLFRVGQIGKARYGCVAFPLRWDNSGGATTRDIRLLPRFYSNECLASAVIRSNLKTLPQSAPSLCWHHILVPARLTQNPIGAGTKWH